MTELKATIYKSAGENGPGNHCVDVYVVTDKGDHVHHWLTSTFYGVSVKVSPRDFSEREYIVVACDARGFRTGYAVVNTVTGYDSVTRGGN